MLRATHRPSVTGETFPTIAIYCPVPPSAEQQYGALHGRREMA